MAQYCSNCGPVKAGQKFCINCGSEILLQSRMKETTNKKVIDRISTDGPRNQNSVVNRTRGEELKLKKRKPQRKKGVFITMLGIILLSVVTIYIMNLQKEQEIAEQKTSMMEIDDIRTAIFEEMADSNMEEDAQSSEADKTFAQEDEEPSEAVEPESVVVEEGKHSETDFNKLSQEDIFSIYEKRLEELRIDNRITVGEWNVGLLQNGKLSLSATNPTDKALEEIFQLYDFGEMEPLFTWAEDVYEVAEELEEIFDANWIIDVGGNCRSVGPETLPQTDIMNYSGSCGISIPVLSGTSREDLSLIINEKVFFHGDDGVTMRDMESSRIVEEIDVEATITEIRAIYHRINESLDDRLFVQKLEEHETKYLNASGIMEKKVVYDRNTDITTEYYAWGDGLLCFVFTTDGFGNENRYYFKDNLLIRWIDENRQTIDIQEGRNNPQYLEWEAHWIEEFY